MIRIQGLYVRFSANQESWENCTLRTVRSTYLEKIDKKSYKHRIEFHQSPDFSPEALSDTSELFAGRIKRFMLSKGSFAKNFRLTQQKKILWVHTPGNFNHPELKRLLWEYKLNDLTSFYLHKTQIAMRQNPKKLSVLIFGMMLLLGLQSFVAYRSLETPILSQKENAVTIE